MYSELVDNLIDKEAEQAVLGGLMTDKWVIPNVETILGADPAIFFTKNHQVIYTAILSIFNRVGDVDPILVANELNRVDELNRAGGSDYLYELQSPIVETESTAFYAEILLEKYHRRKLISTTNKIKEIAADETIEVSEVLTQCQELVFGIGKQNGNLGFEQTTIPLKRNLEHIQNPDVHIGLSTGFTDVDALTGGLKNGNLIIIAARPSMGKTSFVLNIAQDVGITQKKPVAIFTLEMPTEDITMRMLSAETRINFKRLETGKFPDDQWHNVVQCMTRISEAPIYLKSAPGITVQNLRAQARRLKIELPDLALIVIDYMQLMRSGDKHSNKESEIGEISNSLKELALELGIPIIACSQLNREVEKRPDKRPKLSDIRESGRIEQDADIVAFLHREDYYEEDITITDDKVEANLLIKKNRNGPVGTIDLYFNKPQMRFENRLV